MLARKYYAQRGHSKGSMNTHPVSQSSSSRTKRLMNCAPSNINVKTMPKRSSSEHTTLKKMETTVCTEPHPEVPPMVPGLNNECTITKPIKHKKTQGEHLTEHAKLRASCDSDDYYGVIPHMNNCAHT